MEKLAGRRVAIISQGLGRIEPPQAHGSIATWTFETSRYLSRHCSVLLVEFGNQPLRTRVLEHDGATYLYLPTVVNRILNAVHRKMSVFGRSFQTNPRRTVRPDYASVFHNLGYILQAAWHVRRRRCDIIHLHNFSQFVPVVRAINPKARIILHMNCEWLSQHDPDMIGWRVRRADAIVCCSGHIRRRFVEAFPGHEAQSHVVFNGSNFERFLPSENVAPKDGSKAMRVVFVGRISPEKGLHILVDAFATVAQSFPNVTLELIGGAGSLPKEFLVGLSRDPLVKKLEGFYQMDYLAEVKRRIPETLRSRIVFHGNVGHDELAVLYRSATIFVSPSFSDAFPLTVVEAMAAGLPVVASAVGGIPEAVVEGETGLLVEPDNTDALAAAVSRLLGNNQLRLRMGTAGRTRALKLFSWRAISEQVAQVYAGTADQDGTG